MYIIILVCVTYINIVPRDDTPHFNLGWLVPFLIVYAT